VWAELGVCNFLIFFLNMVFLLTQNTVNLTVLCVGTRIPADMSCT